MLPKISRLVKDKEFENVFKKGRSSYDKVIGTKMIKNELGINRFGIIISSKVSKKAIVRNKIKRQIRGIVKERINKLVPGHDLVFICLPGIVGRSFKEIENSIDGHFKRLRILRVAVPKKNDA
jgi:ribonuclease P protein component